jgi:hypothetical protein
MLGTSVWPLQRSNAAVGCLSVSLTFLCGRNFVFLSFVIIRYPVLASYQYFWTRINRSAHCSWPRFRRADPYRPALSRKRTTALIV